MLILFQGVRARRLAEQLCRELYPGEPLQGSWICANEPTRFVVRVFCGHEVRTTPYFMLPPWKICVIVAVHKTTLAAEQIIDDTPYHPILR